MRVAKHCVSYQIRPGVFGVLFAVLCSSTYSSCFTLRLDTCTLRQTQGDTSSGRGMSDGMLMRPLRPTTGHEAFTVLILSRPVYVRLHTTPTDNRRATDTRNVSHIQGKKLSLVLAAGCVTNTLRLVDSTLLVDGCLYTHEMGSETGANPSHALQNMTRDLKAFCMSLVTGLTFRNDDNSIFE